MRTVRLALCVCLLAALCAVSSHAQTVAEGEWINLFDGESTYGWTQFGDAT